MTNTTPWIENTLTGGFVRAIAGTDSANPLNQVARHDGKTASVRIRSGHAPTHEDRFNWASCPTNYAVSSAAVPVWCDKMLALLGFALPDNLTQ